MRPEEAAEEVALDAISIHAPIKDATFDVDDLAANASNFNSRTHKGCDRVAE